jgi:hypothetical protein
MPSDADLRLSLLECALMRQAPPISIPRVAHLHLDTSFLNTRLTVALPLRPTASSQPARTRVRPC